MISMTYHARLPLLAAFMSALLIGCASKKEDLLPNDPLIRPAAEQEPAYIPTYSTNVVKGWPMGRSLDATDVSRVRFGEEVHAYHLGRLPSKDLREMHEAHTVYRVEQNPRWDTRLPATPMDSRGAVLGVIEPSRAEVPKSDIIDQERQSLMAKSLAMQKTMNQLTALQRDLEKKRTQFEVTEQEAKETKEYLEKVRVERDALEEKLKKATDQIRELQDNERLRGMTAPPGLGNPKRK